MYSALSIARYIIDYCNEKKIHISNLKLQKLLYFIQAVFLVQNGKEAFVDEIEAWSFGPVVPTVYHKFKRFGASLIPKIYGDEDEWDFFEATTNNYIKKEISKNDKELINNIIDKLSRLTATELVDITHKQDPWKDNYKPYWNNIIPKEDIIKYFQKG